MFYCTLSQTELATQWGDTTKKSRLKTKCKKPKGKGKGGKGGKGSNVEQAAYFSGVQWVNSVFHYHSGVRSDHYSYLMDPLDEEFGCWDEYVYTPGMQYVSDGRGGVVVVGSGGSPGSYETTTTTYVGPATTSSTLVSGTFGGTSSDNSNGSYTNGGNHGSNSGYVYSSGGTTAVAVPEEYATEGNPGAVDDRTGSGYPTSETTTATFQVGGNPPGIDYQPQVGYPSGSPGGIDERIDSGYIGNPGGIIGSSGHAPSSVSISQQEICSMYSQGTAPHADFQQSYTISVTINMDEGVDETEVFRQMGDVLREDVALQILGCGRRLRRRTQQSIQISSVNISDPVPDPTCKFTIL